MADFGGYTHHADFRSQVHDGILDWLSVCGMSVLILGLIFINLLLPPRIKEFLTSHKDADHKPIILQSATIVSLTLSAICTYASTIIVLIYNDFNHQLYLVDVLTKFSLCLYCGCQTLMIYLFTERLGYVFNNTAIGYPKYVIQILHILCGIFSVFYVFFMVCFIFEFFNVYYVAAVIWIVLYFCLSLMLCMLFVRKVEALMIHATSIDKELLYVILKSIVLVPLSIASSFVFFMVMTCILIVFSPGKWSPPAMFWNVLDCTVSGSCLSLLFSWGDDYYNKYCRCIHTFCEKRKMIGITKKMLTVSETKSKSDETQTSDGAEKCVHGSDACVSSQSPSDATHVTESV